MWSFKKRKPTYKVIVEGEPTGEYGYFWAVSRKTLWGPYPIDGGFAPTYEEAFDLAYGTMRGEINEDV